MTAMGTLLIIIGGDTALAPELARGLAAFGSDVRGPARTLADARKLLQGALPELALINTQPPTEKTGWPSRASCKLVAYTSS
jgi:hypothetical protein